MPSLSAKEIQEIQQPQMSDLPCERLPSENHSVVATTGINFIGLFPVSRFCRHATRHAHLFTCLVVRAVHLGIAEKISTDSTMSCIRRFISRCGKPKKKILSDNGKSFLQLFFRTQEKYRSSKSIKKITSNLHIVVIEIEWKFNPPFAPHFCGSWKRLVQLLKMSLYKVIGSTTLTDESLSTFTCEIVSKLKSCTLTNTSSDINDPLPLTPNHLLFG